MPDIGRESGRQDGGAEPELVTIRQREKLGYGRPQDVDNPEVQRLALANREAIEAEVRAQVEAVLGREVEVTNIHATYPYRAVNVTCVTPDEPSVAVNPFVTLDERGRVSWVDTSSMLHEEATVSALYQVAYAEQFDAMRAYLASEWPGFTGLPAGYARSVGAGEHFYVRFDGEPAVYGEVQAWAEGIYAEFTRQPERSAQEWRALFEAAPEGLVRHLELDLVATGPESRLSRAEARRIADDVRGAAAFEGFESWGITIGGHLVLTEGWTFHHAFRLQALPWAQSWPEWMVDETIDGASQW